MKDAEEMNFANNYTKTQDQSKECIPEKFTEIELKTEIEKVMVKKSYTRERSISRDKTSLRERSYRRDRSNIRRTLR